MLSFEYVQHFISNIFAADVIGAFSQLLPDGV
jgi:hypothetical protein